MCDKIMGPTISPSTSPSTSPSMSPSIYPTKVPTNAHTIANADIFVRMVVDPAANGLGYPDNVLSRSGMGMAAVFVILAVLALCWRVAGRRGEFKSTTAMVVVTAAIRNEDVSKLKSSRLLRSKLLGELKPEERIIVAMACGSEQDSQSRYGIETYGEEEIFERIPPPPLENLCPTRRVSVMSDSSDPKFTAIQRPSSALYTPRKLNCESFSFTSTLNSLSPTPSSPFCPASRTFLPVQIESSDFNLKAIQRTTFSLQHPSPSTTSAPKFTPPFCPTSRTFTPVAPSGPPPGTPPRSTRVTFTANISQFSSATLPCCGTPPSPPPSRLFVTDLIFPKNDEAF